MRSLVLSPWTNLTELQTVYNCIYNSNSNSYYNSNDDNNDMNENHFNENNFNYEMLLFAKNKLTIWLTRIQTNHEINVNLMATKAILNALIEDNNSKQYCDESSVYSLYALSVIRFCTAISQYSNESNMKSVKRLAHRYSCPEWIIECRHSLCHSSHNQPSIQNLRNAALIALNWLKKFFWLKIIANNNHNNCFHLIERFINSNEIKIRKKIKNEMIFAMKYSKNELISALVKHFVKESNNKNEINYESLKIPKSCKRKFVPILAIVNSHNSLSTLLYLITDKFDSQNPFIRHLALSWFSTIMKAINSDNKVSKFERCFTSVTYNSVMPKIEWIRLLYRIAKRPNEHTSSLIVLIAPIVSHLISDQKIQMMIDLSNQFCTHNDSQIDNQLLANDNSNEEYNIKSVKDLIKSVDGNDFNEINISDTTEWSEINLGATHSRTNQD